MKIHPRYYIVENAKTDAVESLNQVIEKHDLTYGEIFSILGYLLSNQSKYMIRDERHPENDKRGDEA